MALSSKSITANLFSFLNDEDEDDNDVDDDDEVEDDFNNVVVV